MSLKTLTHRLTGVGCYGEACAASHALELLGERWALLIIRELLLGPKRFSDLRADLPGLSANVLTQRLRSLEATGVVRRAKLALPAPAHVYELTEWGAQIEPVFMALGRWGVRSPFQDPSLPITPTALMLSLPAMFSADRARGLRTQVWFRIAQERFSAAVARSRIEVSRGENGRADLVLTGDTAAVASALYGGIPLACLEEAGIADVTGDRDAAERLLTLFPLPTKVTL